MCKETSYRLIAMFADSEGEEEIKDADDIVCSYPSGLFNFFHDIVYVGNEFALMERDSKVLILKNVEITEPKLGKLALALGIEMSAELPVRQDGPQVLEKK